jgi:hypothetical protein
MGDATIREGVSALRRALIKRRNPSGGAIGRHHAQTIHQSDGTA